MKLNILFTSILFSLALVPQMTPAAHALGCVNADISVQANISGSQGAPGSQTNNGSQTIDPACVGNANINKSTQLNVGADGANQTRNSNQYNGGSGQNIGIPASVMDAGNINFKASNTTNIQTPALDAKYGRP